MLIHHQIHKILTFAKFTLLFLVILLLLLLFYCSIMVVCIYPPPLPSNPSHPHLPPLLPPHLGFVHVSFIIILEKLSPFSPIIPSSFPSRYHQFVLNFSVSVYISLACLFCWLGPTYRWDHMVLVFHRLAYFTYHNSLQFHPCCCKE